MTDNIGQYIGSYYITGPKEGQCRHGLQLVQASSLEEAKTKVREGLLLKDDELQGLIVKRLVQSTFDGADVGVLMFELEGATHIARVSDNMERKTNSGD